MPKTTPSEREMDVLKVLWELGESRVRDVHEVMSPNGEFAFTTIQTVMRIMCDKELVTARLEGRTLFYTPCYTSEQASSRFLHKVFDGAVDKLVVNMLKTEELSVEEMRSLEKLIAKSRRAKQQEG